MLTPDAFDDIYGDLPDGAYWAAAEENGLYPEDFDSDMRDDEDADN